MVVVAGGSAIARPLLAVIDGTVLTQLSTPPAVWSHGPAAAPGTRVARAVAAAESAAGSAAGSADVAVAAIDLGTGDEAAGAAGAVAFPAASLAKLVVAIDVLDRRRLDGLRVDDHDLELLARMLGPSDDAAMNEFWNRFDGAHAAGRVRDRLALSKLDDPSQPGKWGDMEVCPLDMARLWRHVLRELPAPDRDLLVNDARAAPAIAADGFDQGFGLLSPQVRGPNEALGKQGWMAPSATGERYLHSSGVVVVAGRAYALAVMTATGGRAGWPASRDTVDRSVRAAVAAAR